MTKAPTANMSGHRLLWIVGEPWRQQTGMMKSTRDPLQSGSMECSCHEATLFFDVQITPTLPHYCKVDCVVALARTALEHPSFDLPTSFILTYCHSFYISQCLRTTLELLGHTTLTPISVVTVSYDRT